jgi:spore maturation protein CgeB
VSSERLDIVIIGLSITSSWGNGHATTYRALVAGLTSRGHRVLFLERDVPWYADNRDLPRPPHGATALYSSVEELSDRFGRAVAEADLVMVGSFVPEGRTVARWALERARGLVAFYDIDTPATLQALEEGRCEYLDRALVPAFDLYLSFTGGPILARLENELGAQRARPLYCSFDGATYYPEPVPARWDLGYMGTYSADRQGALDRLLLEPARAAADRRFVVAGAQYPDSLAWPGNVQRIAHLAPADHRAFYCGQRFTLNVTRGPMVAWGFSPSVRLFEAAACAVPIISDAWPGLDTVLEPGREILVARGAADTLGALALPEDEARRLGTAARRRVVQQHSAQHRAEELERHVLESGPRSRIRVAQRA